jgi:hypothetical protein
MLCAKNQYILFWNLKKILFLQNIIIVIDLIGWSLTSSEKVNLTICIWQRAVVVSCSMGVTHIFNGVTNAFDYKSKYCL